MLASLNWIRAALLGGLAAVAVLCFCLTIGGVAWLCVVPFFVGDHDPGALSSYVPSVAFALPSVVGCVLSCRFGWKVGRDWYRTGRS